LRYVFFEFTDADRKQKTHRKIINFTIHLSGNIVWLPFAMVDNADRLPKSFFRSTRYILFWIGSLFSNMGSWMQQIAEPWVVLSLSNSPFWVGLDGFALNAPGLIFTLWGGVLADRYNKRKVVFVFQALQFLCVATLVVLLVGGWLKVWMIVCISFLVGLTDALSMPSFQSIVPSLVKQHDIKRAVSLNSTQFNLSRVLGPAIAGIVIVRFGAVACFSANAASYLPFFLALYFIYPHKVVETQLQGAEEKPVELLRAFVKLLRNREVSLPLLTTLATNLFCGPLVTFCPVLIKNVFHGEVGNFGGAMAAFGVGGLIGAASSFIPLPASVKRNRFAAMAAVFLALVVVAIGLNHSLPLLIVLLVLAGAALTTVNISINTFLQENAVNAMRGRIASMYQLTLSGGISIGALLTGFTVSKLNISDALVLNGAVAVGLLVWLVWRQGGKAVVS
jgi:predicted MFS family arabinose efflux permease